jgi:hypothetical protein
MSNKDIAESPGELGARYWSELRELVASGEISSAFAQRVVDDLFEPREPGKPPVLKWSAWRAHRKEQQELASVLQSRIPGRLRPAR